MLALRFTRRSADHVTTAARRRLLVPANTRRDVMPTARPAHAERRRRERTAGWGRRAPRTWDRSGSSDGGPGVGRSPLRTAAPIRQAVAAPHLPGAAVARTRTHSWSTV